MATALAALDIADPADVWTELGFSVGPGPATTVGATTYSFGSGRKGISAWRVAGLGPNVEIDGLPVAEDRPVPPVRPAPHPNGVVALDHIVVLTPDHGRTIAAIEATGLPLKRVRDTNTYGTPARQGFFRLDDGVILEIVGPAEPMGDGPPRFYGLAFTVVDLDETAAYLGERLRPAKDAVQPGRRIATLDKSAGSTVAIAFMTPEPATS